MSIFINETEREIKVHSLKKTKTFVNLLRLYERLLNRKKYSFFYTKDLIY